MWVKNGALVFCHIKPAISATNKNDYIPVKEGEKYFFNIYGLGQTNAVPMLFLDEKDNYIQDFFTGLYEESKIGFELTVPFDAKKCILQIIVYNL